MEQGRSEQKGHDLVAARGGERQEIAWRTSRRECGTSTIPRRGTVVACPVAGGMPGTVARITSHTRRSNYSFVLGPLMYKFVGCFGRASFSERSSGLTEREMQHRGAPEKASFGRKKVI